MVGKNKKFVMAAVAAVLTGGMAVGSAQAATTIPLTLNGVDSGWRAIVDPGIDLVTFSVDSDYTSVSVEKLANFTSGPNSDGFIEPLKITFYQVSGTATTSKFLKISDELVENHTGVDWTGFVWSLESDHMGPSGGPQFVPADSSDFGLSPFTSSSYDLGNTRLTATGGTVADGSFWDPGDPSVQGASGGGSLVIQASPYVSGNVRQVFRLKEQPQFGGSSPVIPLPAAAWSSLTGLLGLGIIGNAKHLRRLFI